MKHLAVISEIATSRAKAIREVLDSGFEKELFDAVIENLLDVKNTLRLNNFAFAAREFIRIYRDNRSDDNTIRSCTWYDCKKNGGKITRRDRMHYVIHKGLSPQYVASELDIDINKTINLLLKDIDTLNKYTHISNTFKKDTLNNDIALSLFDSLWDFIVTIETTKDKLCEQVESKVEKIVNDTFVYEFFAGIDELSTHSSISEADVAPIELINLDAKKLQFAVSGTLSVDLQWGSDSDVRKGDGAECEISVPFSMEIHAEIGRLEELEVISYEIDTDPESGTF